MIVPFACCLWMAPLSPEDQKGRRPALIRPLPPTSHARSPQYLQSHPDIWLFFFGFDFHYYYVGSS